jgi:hypothetical protein
VFECYFHSCGGKEKNNGSAELLKLDGSKLSLTNVLRKEVLQKWIKDEMEGSIGHVKNADEGPMNRIHLGASMNFMDACYQCKVVSVSDLLPKSINSKKLVQLLT